MKHNNVWDSDLLERKDESDYLQKYLINRHIKNSGEPFVLNINAEWGFGKTYFLKNLAMDLENKKHPVIYFDAWKNDFTNNPLLAFMSELNNSLKPYLNQSTVAKGFFEEIYETSKSIIKPIAIKKLTGHGIDELNELLKDGEDDTSEIIDADLESGITSIISKASVIALSEHKSIQSNIEIFKTQMTKLLKYIENKLSSKNLPMFVFIDELDRCRPNYAIELLESIKHIFDINSIVFVVATDSKQLSHSINAVYGDRFASERYLKRFFHQEYNLAEPDNYAYANYLFDKHVLLTNTKLFSPLDSSLYQGKNKFVELFCGFSAFFKLSFRDQEQAVLMLDCIVLSWDSEELIHLAYILFLIMLKQTNTQIFTELHEMSITHRQSAVDSVFIKKIGAVGKITFKDYNAAGDRLTEYDCSVGDLIAFYLKALPMTYSVYNNHNSRKRIDEKILREFGKTLPGISIMNGYQMAKGLHVYPELVLRAGQFS
jgi:KAP family P-loop domain